MNPRPEVPTVTAAVRPRCGFTLIELMTVLVIIAVLVGLLFPLVGLARANARQAKCTSNLRGVAVAFNEFAADYQGYFPAVTYNTGHLDGRVNPNKSHWWLELKPYIGADIKAAGAIDGSPLAICPDGLTGMNANINYYYQTPRAAIVQPPKTILVGDSKSHALSVWIGDPTGEKFESSDPQRHRGRANYLFVDGHVESLAIDDAYKVFKRDPYAQ